MLWLCAETYDGQSSCIVDYSYEGAGKVLRWWGESWEFVKGDFRRFLSFFLWVEHDDFLDHLFLVMFKGDI